MSTMLQMPKRRNAWSTVWRIWPLPSLRYSVETAAAREGLSAPDMLIRLAGEALKARAAIEPASTTSS
jgi:hypothetical protein